MHRLSAVQRVLLADTYRNRLHPALWKATREKRKAGSLRNGGYPVISYSTMKQTHSKSFMYCTWLHQYMIAIRCHCMVASIYDCNTMSLHGCMIMLLQSKICVKNKVFQAVWMQFSILVASDGSRCHQMSHNNLFYRWICRCNFAKSEPIDGLQHLLTDSSTPLTSRSNPPEVDSLFKRTEQVVFLYDRKFSAIQKPTCPPSRSGDFPPKSENLTENAKQPK